MNWVPKIREGFDVLSVQLSADLGFVLAFVDGQNDVQQIAELTDHDLSSLYLLLKQLVTEGVIEDGPEDAGLALGQEEQGGEEQGPQDFFGSELDDILGPVSQGFDDEALDDWGDRTDVDPAIPAEGALDEADFPVDRIMPSAVSDEGSAELVDEQMLENLSDFSNELGDDLFAKTPVSATSHIEDIVSQSKADAILAEARDEEEIAFVEDDSDAVDAEDEEEILVIADDDDDSDDDEEEIAFVEDDAADVTDSAAVGMSESALLDLEAKIDILPMDALQESEPFPFLEISLAAEILPVSALDVYGELMQQKPSQRRQDAALGEGERLLAYALDPDPLVANALLANSSCKKETAVFFAQHQAHSECLHELVSHSRLMDEAEIRTALCNNPQVPESAIPTLIANLDAQALADLAANENAAIHVRQAAAKDFGAKYSALLPQVREALLLQRDGLFLPLLAADGIDDDTVDLLCQERYDSGDMLRALVAFAGTPMRLLQVLYRQQLTMDNDDIKAGLRAHPNWPK